ncbi:non-ribosomal peptide synthetase [Nocardia gipuzkoensis]|uniref:non-ribosomal peptide synthetase n=1 Tax=Nocardia gipuzkoensis TaxID=2749991 RepID=UPI001E5DDE28|nr:non-ribosomal peptide synthetase [Nocardia gipuzkoensis]UGT71268.1 non-ribosomal peptide synthetase [Nocardia gipuzkoensis]
MTVQSAGYHCTPLQEWLAGRISEPKSWINTGRVQFPDGKSLSEAVSALSATVGLSRVGLVHDPAHGVILRVGDAPGGTSSEEDYGYGFAVSADTEDEAVVEIRVPALLADPPSIRLLQRALVDCLRGVPVSDGRLSDWFRYAAWQRSLSSHGSASPAPEEVGHLTFERPEGTGRGDWASSRLTGPAATAFHAFCTEREITADAALLSIWRLALRAVGATGGLPIWVAMDRRIGEVPSDVLGHLSSYRVWHSGAESIVDVLADAAGWLDSAQRDDQAWGIDSPPTTLPMFSYTSVPAELVLELAHGRAVLGSPVPAPFATGMMLTTSIDSDSIELRLWYDTGRFDAADAAELVSVIGRLATQLPEIAGNGQCWRGDRAAESRVCAGGRLHYRSLFERVRDSAASNPDAPAVSCADRLVTYRELIAAAQGIAGAVRASGDGIEDRVGVLVPQGPDLVSALLGINAAGAAYVPLDYGLPAARIESMLRAAEVRTVVCDVAARHLIPPDIRTIDPSVLSAPSRVDLGTSDDPDALAYVLFTSGSTGEPKGVLVTRHGLDSYLSWAVSHYSFDRGAAVVTHTPPIFDLGVTSLLAPLIAGQHVRVAPPSQGLDGLPATLRAVGDVSLLKLTPTHLAAIDLLLGPDSGVRVHTVVVGGEDLATDTVVRWLRHHPESVVYNEYGPTETVVGCSVRRFETREAGWPTVAIGHPIDGAGTSVRGSDLRDLEPGVVGELCIGGRVVARGYANDPRRTAERFVPDPSGPPGSRMYRSGDLAVDTASRGLRYLGRRDRQRKVRGYRVEPGEIEHRLRDLPGITDAVVRAAAAEGEDILVAYVLGPRSEGAVDAAAIRDALTEHLPDYLLPDVVLGMDSLPVTANGKLDEQRLPDYRAVADPPSRTVQTATEALVLTAWSEVLGRTVSNPDARFFELGGTSFGLVKINSRLRAECGIELAITEMFERPTARGLASLIDDKLSGRAGAPRYEPATGADRLRAMEALRWSRESRA